MAWNGWRVMVLLGALLGIASLLRHARTERAELAGPLSLEGADYAGSGRCRACHEGHYASWHRTYHRRMTQEASEATVLGDFSGERVDYFGVRAEMGRSAEGGFQMRMGEGRGAFTAQVVRTVGSHRYQQYLAQQDDLFVRLPIAWDVEAQRFIHMNGAFLTPDPDVPVGQRAAPADFNRHVVRWNDNCIFCHNVAPNPGADGQGRFDSRVAELGVACEACHGPAGRHVEANRDPVRRYLQHLDLASAHDIAGPSRLPQARSAEVCGRCHGQRITRDIDEVHQHGDRFVPGEALSKYSTPLARDTTLGGEEGVFAARFWSDGTPRLTAYEYQGYLQSPCRANAAFDCGSCHSMHDAEPSGQVRAQSPEHAAQRGGDHLCIQCHGQYEKPEAQARHSGHAADGPGARCLDCHMPQVVYGLVRSHRSHRIAVPVGSAPGATPDACGLCHTQWDGARLASARTRLYPKLAQRPAAPASAESAPAPLAMVDLLFAGDPVERSVAASALGRPGALAAGLAPARALSLCLEVITRDDYPAVREIARRSALSMLLSLGIASDVAEGLRGLQPTARLAERQACVDALLRALPRAAVVPLDQGRITKLQRQATSMAIAIGE